MTRKQRATMTRIISDMIKADNIIEENEIKDMKMLMPEYAITHQEMSDVRMIRFTDAVNTLKVLYSKESIIYPTGVKFKFLCKFAEINNKQINVYE